MVLAQHGSMPIGLLLIAFWRIAAGAAVAAVVCRSLRV
jgi:hypothetical protein